MICSDKVPINQRDTAGRCFQKGLKVGFVSGINVGIKQQKIIQKKVVKKVKKKALKKQKAIEAITKVLAQREFKTITLNQATNDALKSLAQRRGIPGYRNKNRDTIIQELRQKGITNVKVPR